MAEPEDITVAILRELRADIREMRAEMTTRFAEVTDRVDTIEIKLDGLTHAVIAGFGSIVHELDDLKQRVSRLETERA